MHRAGVKTCKMADYKGQGPGVYYSTESTTKLERAIVINNFETSGTCLDT